MHSPEGQYEHREVRGELQESPGEDPEDENEHRESEKAHRETPGEHQEGRGKPRESIFTLKEIDKWLLFISMTHRLVNRRRRLFRQSVRCGPWCWNP